jgi:hypothetical protein
MSLIKMPRDSDRKGTILLIGRVCSPLSAWSRYQRQTAPLQQPKKEFLKYCLSGGNWSRLRLGESLGLLPLAHRSEEPGNDIFSPHFYVRGGIKTT